MPTIEELGKKVKAKYPGSYDDLPDVELGKRVKEKYPEAYKDFSESTFSRIEELRARAKPKGEVSRKASAHLLGIQQEQSAAEQKQAERDAIARAAGTAAEMLPFAAAAPLTGGASLGVGLGLMGAAGVAGGLAREGAKAIIGSSEIPQTPAALAKTLGIDALTGMASEAGGRVVTKVIGEMVPSLIKRSAVNHEIGARVMAQDFDKTRQALDILSGGTHVDVTGSFHKLLNDIALLPQGTTKLGQRLTKLDQNVQAIVNDVTKDIRSAGGFPGSAQESLDALIEMKGRLNQIAWDKTLKVTSGRQAMALQRFAGELDKDIRSGLKAISPSGEAEKLFNHANSILKLQRQQKVGIIMAEEALKRMTYRMGAGAAFGGFAGGYSGYRHGGATGMLKRGAEGAVAGAAIGATQAAIPRMSAWVYEMAMKHPAARDEMQKAIRFYIAGEDGKAAAAASRALMTADIRNNIKEALRHPDVVSPVTPPEAMQPPATAQR